jgi:hypothetical protein
LVDGVPKCYKKNGVLVLVGRRKLVGLLKGKGKRVRCELRCCLAREVGVGVAAAAAAAANDRHQTTEQHLACSNLRTARVGKRVPDRHRMMGSSVHPQPKDLQCRHRTTGWIQQLKATAEQRLGQRQPPSMRRTPHPQLMHGVAILSNDQPAMAVVRGRRLHLQVQVQATKVKKMLVVVAVVGG